MRRGGGGEFYDVSFATCYELLRDFVFITLSNDKVYIGQLVAATLDPNEPRRFIRIIPMISGYRDAVTKRVR